MKSGDRSRGDRSDVGEWVDIARRSRAADSAQIRRAEMLCASHREARIESTLMADFDRTRARRADDDTTTEIAIGAALGALERRPRSAPVERAAGPRVASALHTPRPRPAIRLQRPKERARHDRIAMAIALTIGLGLGALGGSLAAPGEITVLREPPAKTDRASDPAVVASIPVVDAEASQSGSIAVGTTTAVVSAIDPQDRALSSGAERAERGGAIDLLARARSRHRSARLLHAARVALEHDRDERAERLLRIVARRWPRRVEAVIATRALAEIRGDRPEATGARRTGHRRSSDRRLR